MPETPEERLQRLRGEVAQRAALFKKLVDEFGPGVLEVVREELLSTVQADFAQMALPKRDLSAVMSLLWDHVGEDLDYTVEAQTPTHLQIKVTRCIWADEYLKHNAGDVGFAFSCCWDYGFCQGLNPAMRFTRTKTLMHGDDCCDHTYDLKPES